VRVLAIYELDEPHNHETVAFGSRELPDGGARSHVQRRGCPNRDGHVLLAHRLPADVYGGVDEFSIDDRRVRLSFSPEAVQTLRVPPEWFIDIEGDDYRLVTDAFARLLS
jgi:hypothetical protein